MTGKRWYINEKTNNLYLALMSMRSCVQTEMLCQWQCTFAGGIRNIV